MFKEKEKEKKNPTTFSQCTRDAKWKLPAIHQCSQLRNLPAPSQVKGAVLSSLLLRWVTHLADEGLAASCPFFLSLFLGFKHTFKSNNTSWAGCKYWATVFLGPYLVCRLKICKRFQFASCNWLWPLCMFSSPQDARFGQGGSREREECKNHCWDGA